MLKAEGELEDFIKIKHDVWEVCGCLDPLPCCRAEQHNLSVCVSSEPLVGNKEFGGFVLCLTCSQFTLGCIFNQQHLKTLNMKRKMLSHQNCLLTWANLLLYRLVWEKYVYLLKWSAFESQGKRILNLKEVFFGLFIYLNWLNFFPWYCAFAFTLTYKNLSKIFLILILNLSCNVSWTFLNYSLYLHWY